MKRWLPLVWMLLAVTSFAHAPVGKVFSPPAVTSPLHDDASYDAAWRLDTLASPAGEFDYGYDGASRLLTSLDLPNGALITNVFDDLGRLSSTSLKTSSASLLNQHAYLRDDAHRPKKQTFTEGNTLEYGYDALSQLTAATGKESGGSSRAHEQFTYAFDTAGNLTSRVNNGLTQTFSITNVLNQLDSVGRSGTLTVAGLTTAAATNVTVNSQSATLHADASFAKSGLSLSDGDNTFTATATDALGRNASDSVTVNLPATVTFDYDDNGNLTDAGSLAYGYDDANQLTSVTESGEWKTEFVYDGLGRMRVRKEYDWNGSAWVQTEEHRYVYDRMLVIQERDGANVPRVSYTRGPDLSGSLQGAGGIGGLLARTDHGSGTHAYYHADGMGNVTALLDEDEQVVARYAYDPFGNLQGLSGPLAQANEYRYSSKLWHAASGLYAYGYRFYSPSLQRWVNRDPIGESGGINLYGFVDNSPLDYVDPFGLSDVCEFAPGRHLVPPGMSDPSAPESVAAAWMCGFLEGLFDELTRDDLAGPNTCSAVVDFGPIDVGGLGTVNKLKKAKNAAEACEAMKPVTRPQRWKQLAEQGNLSKQEIDYIRQHGGEGMFKTFGKELAHPPGRPAAQGFDYSEALPKVAADHRGIEHRYLIEHKTGTTINLDPKPRTGGNLDLPPEGALP